MIEPKDLRGQPVRHVLRDDSVIITGAEYLRKSHATDQLEIAQWDLAALRAAVREAIDDSRLNGEEPTRLLYGLECLLPLKERRAG